MIEKSWMISCWCFFFWGLLMGRAAECNMPLIKRNAFGMDPEAQKRKTKEKKSFWAGYTWIRQQYVVFYYFFEK